nr:uncharacterized protein LOC129433343 [Misgurnus anguillicaudatus]
MDTSLSARWAHQAHVFGLRQGTAEVKDFAFSFLKEARGSGFKEAELKVIFNSCLVEPLKPSELRMLSPLGFPDMIIYLMNREPRGPTGTVPLATIPEDCVVAVASLGDPAPPVCLPRKRGRRASWESASEGSSTESVATTAVPTSPATASAPRPRRKKGRKGATHPPSQSPPGSSAAPPVSPAPQPAAAPPVSPAPQPAAAPPVSPAPQPAAAPPVSPAPQPAAAPPVSPAPSVAASYVPLSSCSSARSPATVSMFSLDSLPNPVSPGLPTPVSAPFLPRDPALFPIVPPVLPALIWPQSAPGPTSPTKTPKPARTPRPKPSTGPKTPCSSSSTLPGLPPQNFLSVVSRV